MLLEEALQRDGAMLLSIDKQKIEFVCKCGTTYTKLKSAICNTSGAFCKDCTDKNTSIKRLTNKIAYMKALLEL